MSEIVVLAEHRQGRMRDISFELISAGNKLAQERGAALTSIILGASISTMAEELSTRVDNVIAVEDSLLEPYNSVYYQKVLSSIYHDRKPYAILIGHTAYGMDLAPSLATELGIPLATDCTDISYENGRLKAIRSVYGGKVSAGVSLRNSDAYVLTIRPGSFSPHPARQARGAIDALKPIPLEPSPLKRFIEFLEAPASQEDISRAEVIVAVGQGIGGPENIPQAEQLAKSLGGVIACSRPVVDRNWLPKEKQVGISGKTVRPKLYVAIGISGAFQHVTAMQDSETIIAINKDPRAPIFGVADYGIVDDFRNILPVLNEKVKKMFK